MFPGHIEYKERTNQMQNCVRAACRKAGHETFPVVYSAYEFEELPEYELPVDNLDDVAFSGHVDRIRVLGCAFFGNDSDYNVEVNLDDPTWLELAVHANAAIIKTEDYHHLFLEGYHHYHNGEQVLELVFGS